MDCARAKKNILDCVVKSLVCVDDLIPFQPNCFEVRACLPARLPACLRAQRVSSPKHVGISGH